MCPNCSDVSQYEYPGLSTSLDCSTATCPNCNSVWWLNEDAGRQDGLKLGGLKSIPSFAPTSLDDSD